MPTEQPVPGVNEAALDHANGWRTREEGTSNCCLAFFRCCACFVSCSAIAPRLTWTAGGPLSQRGSQALILIINLKRSVLFAGGHFFLRASFVVTSGVCVFMFRVYSGYDGAIGYRACDEKEPRITHRLPFFLLSTRYNITRPLFLSPSLWPADTLHRQRNSEENRLAFGITHRVLLSPVTHLSPAAGGRPHPPAKFAKYARVAQEQVTQRARGLRYAWFTSSFLEMLPVVLFLGLVMGCSLLHCSCCCCCCGCRSWVACGCRVYGVYCRLTSVYVKSTAVSPTMYAKKKKRVRHWPLTICSRCYGNGTVPLGDACSIISRNG